MQILYRVKTVHIDFSDFFPVTLYVYLGDYDRMSIAACLHSMESHCYVKKQSICIRIVSEGAVQQSWFLHYAVYELGQLGSAI